MRIKYSRIAIRFLSGLTKKNVERIREDISKLTKKPPEGNIAPMRGTQTVECDYELVNGV